MLDADHLAVDVVLALVEKIDSGGRFKQQQADVFPRDRGPQRYLVAFQQPIEILVPQYHGNHEVALETPDLKHTDQIGMFQLAYHLDGTQLFGGVERGIESKEFQS